MKKARLKTIYRSLFNAVLFIAIAFLLLFYVFKFVDGFAFYFYNLDNNIVTYELENKNKDFIEDKFLINDVQNSLDLYSNIATNSDEIENENNDQGEDNGETEEDIEIRYYIINILHKSLTGTTLYTEKFKLKENSVYTIRAINFYNYILAPEQVASKTVIADDDKQIEFLYQKDQYATDDNSASIIIKYISKNDEDIIYRRDSKIYFIGNDIKIPINYANKYFNSYKTYNNMINASVEASLTEEHLTIQVLQGITEVLIKQDTSPLDLSGGGGNSGSPSNPNNNDSDEGSQAGGGSSIGGGGSSSTPNNSGGTSKEPQTFNIILGITVFLVVAVMSTAFAVIVRFMDKKHKKV